MTRSRSEAMGPLYSQIKSHLLEAIESGQLRPGDRVPSERELTTQFAVSRMTARQALTELENMGRLVRIQGKGTFVATPKLTQSLASLTSFTEDMRSRGMVPGARVLAVGEEPASLRVATALGIREGDRVIKVERLRLADGEPMALETSRVPADCCPDLLVSDLTDRSLYQVLRERGVELARATQSLEAVLADGPEAEVLRVKDGAALLLLERVSCDPQGRPVEYVRSLYRGDRYRFITELIRRGGTTA